MLDIYKTKDALEKASGELSDAKDLICVVADSFFIDQKDTTPYQLKFGAVLFAALDKVTEQQEIIENIVLNLHEFSKELKTSVSYHE